MDHLQLQKLRDLPIEGVAERLGLRVERHKALCPFHDDHHASLTFSPRRNSYRCFACGASGGSIDLVMHRLGLGFVDACRWLADGGGVVLQSAAMHDCHGEHSGAAPAPFDPTRYARYFEQPRLGEAACRFLYGERRLDPRVVRWCRLTSWHDRQGTPWLQVPYYDREGRLVGIQNRNLRPEAGGVPRFRFPTGSQCTIYNLPVLNRLGPGDELYIAEGCSDCWALLSAGHKAIAIPSATLLGPSGRQLLTGLATSATAPTFHMYPDRDAPGERLFQQLHEVLPALVRHALPEGCKDFADYYVATRSRAAPS